MDSPADQLTDETSPAWRAEVLRMMGDKTFPMPTPVSATPTQDALLEPFHSAAYDLQQLLQAMPVQARQAPGSADYLFATNAPSTNLTPTPLPDADPFKAIADKTAELERIQRELGPVGKKILASPITTGKWW